MLFKTICQTLGVDIWKKIEVALSFNTPGKGDKHCLHHKK